MSELNLSVTFILQLCSHYNQVQYPQSKCSRLSLVRDLPPVAGSIIWAKQIDHQLTAYLKRVEDVLGNYQLVELLDLRVAC